MASEGTPSSLSPSLLTALCGAYAQLLRRQRAASTAFLNWPSDSLRSHEFVWLSVAFDHETLMRTGSPIVVAQRSSLFASVQKMYATSQLNPYEREILYGYPYIIGRIDGRPIRAPLFTTSVTMSPTGTTFVISPDEESVQFNTLPFWSESQSTVRRKAVENLLQHTPKLPLSADKANEFITMLGREIPEVAITSLTGHLASPPSRPNSGSFLRLAEQAALFVAPKNSYFLTSDLESIAAIGEQNTEVTALTPLLVRAGNYPAIDFEPTAVDSAAIYYPFPSNRAQRHVAMLIDHPNTRTVVPHLRFGQVK